MNATAFTRDRSNVCSAKDSFHAIRSTFGDLVDHDMHSCAVRDAQSKEGSLGDIISAVVHVALRRFRIIFDMWYRTAGE